MEIKLNAGDKIQVPTGCKATIKENTIVIEEKQEEFKDGDILHSIFDGTMIIFKSFGKMGEMSSHYDNDCLNISERWLIASFRHATEEEKQAFFDELKAKGLRWNADTKTMERIRERVKYGKSYLYINEKCKVVEVYDNTDFIDDSNWEVGNYYLPSERAQAEEDAKAVKAIFEKRLKV